MATETAQNPFFNDLLNKLIGSSATTSTNETLDVENLIKALTNTNQTDNTLQTLLQNQQGTQNQSTTGTTNTGVTGTQSQNLSGTQTQNTGVTGTQTQNQNIAGTTSSTQSSNADISALQQVFQQQQAGITPDVLKAIFTEGAKQVPGLVASTANAVGARSAGNSPLATALTELNSNLTNSAATQSQAMRNASGNTAAQIAELTKQLTTAGTTGQNVTGTTGTTQNTVGTTGTTQNTTGTNTSNTVADTLQNILGSTTQNTQGNTGTNKTSTGTTSTDTTQNQGSQKNSDTDQSSTINAKSAGLTAGAALLGSLLNGKDGGTGLGDLLSKGGGLLKSLFGSGATPNIGNGFAGLFNTVSPGIATPGLGFDVISDPTFGGFSPDLSNGIGDIFGFADGGLVDIPKLALGTSVKKSPNINALLGLLDGGSSSASSIGDLSSLVGGTGSSGGSSSGESGTSDSTSPGGGPANNASAPATPASIAVANTIGQTAASAITGMAFGPIPGLIANIVGLATTGKPQSVGALMAALSGMSGANADSGGPAGGTSGGTVSIGPVTAETPEASMDQAAVDAATVSADTGDSSGVGDSPGTSGVGGGDGSGGGMADGGRLAVQKEDPNGIMDTLLARLPGGNHIALSGGEYIMPKDVTDKALPMLEMIKNMFHTPAGVQRGNT